MTDLRALVFGADARRPSPVRLLLGAVGIAMLGYGVFRILQFPQRSAPLHLGKWLILALILHDGILVPIVTAIGWLLAKVVPGRARAYLQGALIAGGLVTSVALALIYRQGISQPGQALLDQDYTAHLLLILAVIAAGALLLYGVRVLRDRRAETHDRS